MTVYSPLGLCMQEAMHELDLPLDHVLWTASPGETPGTYMVVIRIGHVDGTRAMSGYVVRAQDVSTGWCVAVLIRAVQLAARTFEVAGKTLPDGVALPKAKS